MTWEEFMAARQLLVEEKIGVHQRAQVEAEDRTVEATRDAIRRSMPGAA
jgi:hypothetical protein